MKKRLLNTLIASSIGLVSIISTATAYFVTDAKETIIPVTLSSKTYDANFEIGSIDAVDSYKLNPDHTSKRYKYKLSVSKSASTTYTQDVLVGSLTVSVTTKSKKLSELLSATNKIDYTNPDKPESPDTVFSTTDSLNSMSLTLSDEQDSNGNYVFTNTMYAPISVINGNEVTLTLSLGDTLSLDDFIELNAATYNINVSLDNATDYEYAYVGGLNVEGEQVWESNDSNMMVPNIYATSWQWMWRADKDYTGSAIKTHKKVSEGSCFSKGVTGVTDETKFTTDGNYIVDVKQGDSIYWDGQNETELIYVKAN